MEEKPPEEDNCMAPLAKFKWEIAELSILHIRRIYIVHETLMDYREIHSWGKELSRLLKILDGVPRGEFKEVYAQLWYMST